MRIKKINSKFIILRTKEELKTGLLKYKDPPVGKYFLFILPDEQIANFHTIGMKFNIDILFYDKDGKIDSKYLNVKPGVEKIKSKTKVKYVIEIPK